MNIKPVKTAKAWALRQEVMWPDKPLDHVKLEDDDLGMHFGLFDEGEMVSVVSLFIRGNEAQFRKLATKEALQGKGYGTTLMKFVITKSRECGADYLWCNSRTEKTAFYEKFGLRKTSKEFEKQGVRFTVMEMDLL